MLLISEWNGAQNLKQNDHLTIQTYNDWTIKTGTFIQKKMEHQGPGKVASSIRTSHHVTHKVPNHLLIWIQIFSEFNALSLSFNLLKFFIFFFLCIFLNFLFLIYFSNILLQLLIYHWMPIQWIRSQNQPLLALHSLTSNSLLITLDDSLIKPPG